MIRTMRHWRSLDGLRAFAVLTVVAYHLDASRIRGGALGVDIFFVLSGFLITGLLIREWEAHAGSVSFSAFYIRRALRLLPAFYAVLIFSAILAGTIAPSREVTPTLSNLPWVFFYLGNLRASLGHSELGLLNPTWSLAQEEQFYLVWPVICVLILSRTRRRLMPAIALILVALGEMIYRVALVRHGASLIPRVQYGPDTRSDGLLIGCALAFALSGGGRFAQVCAKLPHKSVAAVGVTCGVVVAALSVVAPMNRPAGVEFAIPIAVVATGALVWSLVTAPIGPLHWLLGTTPAVWLGRRSYGLYLWHFPIILGIPLAGLHHAARLPIHLGLSIGAAALSYRFIEMPFLRRKQRWQTDLQPANRTPAIPEAATP